MGITRRSFSSKRRTALLRSLPVALALLLFLLTSAESAFARGGFRGGGFRFSGGYRSLSSTRFSRGATGSFFRWGRSTRRSTSLGRSRRLPNTAEAVGGSRASLGSARSLYTRARRQGTLFSTRQEAASAFRSRYASRYSSRFASRPSKRPSYIPQATKVNGRQVPITYSPVHGGYGYVDPALGHWVFFNALANAAVLNSLMANHYYWWGAPPAYGGGGGGSFFTWAIVLFFAFMAFSSLLRLFVRRGPPGW